MSDLTLSLTPDGVGYSDTVTFTVLWVDLSVRWAGQVTPYNRDIEDYKTAHGGSDQLGGVSHFEFAADHHREAFGVELKGVVHPYDFDGGPLRIVRDAYARAWGSATGQDPYAPLGETKDWTSLPPGNDMSGDDWSDLNPFHFERLGEIFNLDFVGLKYCPTPAPPEHYTARVRGNLRACVSYGGLLVSNRVDYWARVSVQYFAGSWTPVEDFLPAWEDNTMGFGETWVSAEPPPP